MEKMYQLVIRKTIDTYVNLSASSPERALQIAANWAADTIPLDARGSIKVTVEPLPNSVKRVDR